MRRSLVPVLVASVLIVTLVLVIGEPGASGTVTLEVERTDLVEGEFIKGTAMTEGDPPLKVQVILEGDEIQIDDETLPEDEHINPFSFPTDDLGGKTVEIRATDASGNITSRIVHIAPKGE